MSAPQVVFVVGPTATGKSETAIRLAEKFSGEIVNADSLQVFQGLDIGTAKPSAEERESCPHHLFDIVPKGEAFTAADYVRRATEICENHFAKKETPLFFVGGSGFYIHALLTGMYTIETPSDGVLEKASKYIEEKGFEEAFSWIKSRDAEFAKKISPQDQYRIERTLQIYFQTGMSLSEIEERKKIMGNDFDYSRRMIALEMDRDLLRTRVTERTEKMVENGLVEEVKGLIDEGFENWKPLQSVGYKETLRHIRGDFDLEAMKKKIVTSTMQLAKRQRTWFRNKTDSLWVPYNDYGEIESKVSG